MKQENCKYRCPYEQREKKEKNERNKLIGMTITLASVLGFFRFGCKPALQTIVDYQQHNQTRAVRTYKSENPDITIVPNKANEPKVMEVSKDTKRQENSNLETKVMRPVEKAPRNMENTSNSNNYAIDANKPTRVSKNGIELIKQFEGFSSVPYDDVGRNAIGYGHTIRKGENFYKINEEDAGRLLAQDLAPVESTVSKYVEVYLNQNQYDALCSFVCNVGGYNFKGSTLLKKLNERDYKGASEEFGRWVHVYGKNGEKKVISGLVTRRQIERELFLSN